MLNYDVESYDYAFLGLNNSDLNDIKNPLLNLTDADKNDFHLHILRIMRNPEYFQWTVKTLLNIDLIPEQVVILQELWTKAFPMYIASRGFGKSFLLAVYSCLKCILIPSTKIVIVGAAFRQSKVIFEYMDTIWKNAPLLQSICSDNSGPRRDVDRCTMRINDSWAMAVPLGDGGKIRGLRAHTIISDEFNCLSHDTLVETAQGLIRIGDQNIDHSKLDIRTGNYDFPYEKLDKYIITPLSDVYEVKLDNGYNIKCSENHPLMTQDGWKKVLELTDSDYIESKNDYIFPKKATIDEKTAWLIGMLISEGSINDKKRIAITTTDHKLAKFIKKEFRWKICESKAYIDKRGWNCKKSYMVYTDDKVLRTSLYELGLDYNTAIDKKIPSHILLQPKHIIMAFLEGLFEGDGSAFLYSDGKNIANNRLGCAYYSVSETLCRDVQVILNKLGYDPYLNNRSSEISDNLQWFVRLNGSDAYDFVSQLNIDRFQIALNNAYVPHMPKNYTWDKARNKWKIHIRHLGKKIQKRFKTEEEAIDAIQLIRTNRYRQVVSVKKLENKEVLYDYHLPVTHSFYAGSLRNHNSIPLEIYETVVAGFAAVSANPVQNVKDAAKRKKMQSDGIWNENLEDTYKDRKHNQSIISGTCGYDFEHFADYWKKYKKTIENKGLVGNSKQSDDEEEGEEIPDYMKNLDWKSFSVIRMPYELIPEGFMDDQQVTRARATMHTGTYQKEYGAVFTSDSQGFFKRSAIEKATANDKNCENTDWPSWCVAPFDPITRGSSEYGYVMGIDPASEQDNFAIVILEVHQEHQRVVYSWTTNKKDFQDRKKIGLTKSTDYYSFCCRKIRELMRAFPTVRIGIDSQGGGYTIAEGLRDEDKLQAGERPILPIIEDKAKETDDLAGDHILELINFANATWMSQSNHGLRKDIEDKVLLFPRFDTLTLSLMSENDKIAFNKLKDVVGESNALRLYDTLEDCSLDIVELKEELSTVVMSVTSNGRERFNTPEIKLDTGKKGRMRKDRYSALVIANMISRMMHREMPAPSYINIGTAIGANVPSKKEDNKMYYGPEWVNEIDNSIFRSVKK